LDPVRLDHEGLALWTQSLLERPGEDGRRVVAWVGHDHSTLVLGRDGTFQGAHGTRLGLGDLTEPETGGAQPSQPAVERFAHRVRQVLQAQAPETAGAPHHWLWSGPGVEVEPVRSALEAALGDLPLASIDAHDEPALFLCRALGTRALQPGPLSCNLRTGAFAHPAAVKARARGRAAVLAGWLLPALVLLGMNLAWRGLVRVRKDRLQARITAVARELSGLPNIQDQKGQELLLVDRELARQAQRAAPFLRALAPSTSSLLAKVLRTSVEQGLSLSELVLTESEASVRGSADHWDACEPLAELLRGAGYDVPSPQRQGALAEEQVHFTIEGKRQDA
jgi:hypothetical protein